MPITFCSDNHAIYVYFVVYLYIELHKVAHSIGYNVCQIKANDLSTKKMVIYFDFYAFDDN